METCIQPVGLGGVSRGSQACVWFTWGPGPTAEPLTDKVPCEWRTNSSGLSAVAGIHQAPVWGQGALRNHILKPQSSGRKVCCHSTYVKTHKFTSKRKVMIHVHPCHDKTTLLWSTTGLYNCFSSWRGIPGQGMAVCAPGVAWWPVHSPRAGAAASLGPLPLAAAAWEDTQGTQGRLLPTLHFGTGCFLFWDAFLHLGKSNKMWTVTTSMPTPPLKDELVLHQNRQPSLGWGGGFPEVLMLLTNSFSFKKHTGHCVCWPRTFLVLLLWFKCTDYIK